MQRVQTSVRLPQRGGGGEAGPHARQEAVCKTLYNSAGLSLKGKGKKTFVTSKETNVHGDALCLMVLGPSLLQRLAVGGGWWGLAVVGGWRLAAVGGGWWGLAVVGGWRLAAVGGG